MVQSLQTFAHRDALYREDADSNQFGQESGSAHL